MGFPSIYGGVLPLVVVNTAISLAVVKNLVDTLLRIVGLKRDDAEQQAPLVEPSWYSAQQQQHHHQHLNADQFDGSEQLPSFVEEIQSTLPLLQFSQLQHQHHRDGDAAESKSERDPQDPTPRIDDEHSQCAVCLCEFESSHLVRKLPNCSHIFHRDCLDKWLNHNQTTCPMCRSTLLTDDLARRHKQQEEILAEELAMWLSVYHTSGLSRGPWWYRGHGSGFAAGWDFH